MDVYANHSRDDGGFTIGCSLPPESMCMLIDKRAFIHVSSSALGSEDAKPTTRTFVPRALQCTNRESF